MAPLAPVKTRELAAFLIVAALTIPTYGFARPAADPLFIERCGARFLPWAWLAVGVGALVVTVLYNRVIAQMSLVRLWPRAMLTCAAVGGLIMAAASNGVPHAEFVLYVWKDIYIVVLVELFWSIANTSFALGRARWLYGLFLAAGTLGGLCAELSVGVVATHFGSLAGAAFAIPLLVAGALLSPFLPTSSAAEQFASRISFSRIVGRAAALLRGSRYLFLFVGLVALVQISLTVIDYQYSIALEAYVPDADERTQIGGQFYAAISLASLVLQLLSGLIIKGLGIPLLIALVPIMLLAGSIAFAVHPRFGLIAAVKIASKALDYSVGRAAKELLYIPLSYEEKTEGKAIVDLLSYRVAKAFASVVLLWLAAARLGSGAVATLVCSLLVAWLAMAWIVGQRFRSDVTGRP